MKVLLSSLLCLFSAIQVHCDVTTHDFSADVGKVFKLVAKSLYKDPCSFIRELVSNSHDAITARTTVYGFTYGENEKEPRVEIWTDKDKRTITINDNGIGMNEEDLVKHLGTIARSGTEELMNMSKEDSEKFIGQFGVGFYSCLAVASRIDVITAKVDEPKYVWSHISGGSSYSIRKAEEGDDDNWNPVLVGTKVILHLRDDPEIIKLLDESELEAAINKSSAFIPVKLYLRVQKVLVKEKAEEGGTEENKEEEKEKEEKKEDDKIEAPIYDFKLVSKAPLWQRVPSDVSKEEYNELYRSMSGDQNEPLAHIHFSVDSGIHSYCGILFIPRYQKFQPFGTDQVGEPISLYVRNVFVTNSVSAQISRPFLIATGIINSNDVSLNVSRETLQNGRIIKDVAKIVILKVIDMFKGLAIESAEKYKTAYNEYSGHLKLAIILEKDKSIKEKVADLLMFHVAPGPDDSLIFLKDYLMRMKESQKKIYFSSGTSISEMKMLPYVAALVSRQYPVLLMKHQFDEPVVQSLNSYNEKEFVNVSKSGLKLDEEETEEDKKKIEGDQKRFEPLIKYLLETFEQTIEKVNLSYLLDKVPMAIVPSEFGWSPAMTKAMKDNSNNPIAQFFQSRKRTLEINPNDKLILGLLKRVATEEKSKELEDDIRTLYDIQCLLSGYDVDDSKCLSNRILSSLGMKYGDNDGQEYAQKMEEVSSPLSKDDL